jgi:hypothetical protein
LRYEVTITSQEAYILDVASLADYLSKLENALLQCESDTSFLELSPDEWLELLENVEADHLGEQLEQRRSILRRFARHWFKRGALVPASVFVSPPLNVGSADSLPSSVIRAASTHVSVAEGRLIRAHLINRFSEQPLLAMKAITKAQLMEARPFRTSEINRLRVDDITDDAGLLFVTTSGFSHLKRNCSRRLVQLPAPVNEAVRNLRDRVRQLSNHNSFMWLRDDQSDMHQDANLVDAALSQALVTITGESQARRHSLRGSAASRLIFPRCEEVIRAIAAGQNLGLLNSEVVEEQWLRVAFTAVQAGHSGMLSILLYYSALWPVVLHAELAATLPRARPGPQISSVVGHCTPASLRKALSRSRKAIGAGRCCVEWDIFDGRLAYINMLPPLASLLEPEAPALPPQDPAIAARPKGVDLKRVHYLVLRLGGLEVAPAVDESRIPMTVVSATEALLAQCQSRDPALRKSMRPKSVQTALCKAAGRELIASVARIRDAGIVSMAVSALTPSGYIPAEPAISGVANVLKALLMLLPSRLTVTILPSAACSNKTLLIRLARVDPNVVVKPTSSRLSAGYRFGITTRDASARGPRPDGEITRLFSLVCQAWLAILLFP